jgi:ATP-dependent DNA helicase RecQ
MLHGTDSDRTRRFGFTRLSTFGLLRERSPEWILALLRSLLTAGWIDLTPTDHPVPLLTRAGREVMRGAAPARVALPRERARPARDAKRSPSPEVGITIDTAEGAKFEQLSSHLLEVAASATDEYGQGLLDVLADG